MNATSANLIERVLPPQTGLRQWVLRFRSRGGAGWRRTARRIIGTERRQLQVHYFGWGESYDELVDASSVRNTRAPR